MTNAQRAELKRLAAQARRSKFNLEHPQTSNYCREGMHWACGSTTRRGGGSGKRVLPCQCACHRS